MELSSRHDVAMGLLVTLSETATPLRVVAVELKTSLSYLEPIAQKFREAGLIYSSRGPGGGYVLARPLEEIMVGEVLALLQPAKQRGRVGIVDRLVHCVACVPLSRVARKRDEGAPTPGECECAEVL